MNTTQLEIWLRHTADVTAEDIVGMVRSPSGYQVEFATWLDNLSLSISCAEKLAVCEVGCEFGVTTLLLSCERFEKHCLDFNPRALELLRIAAARLGQDVTIHKEDMFHTSIAPAAFDIVFNNGVLEHYEFKERVAALNEYSRIVKPGGRVLIGVPNHDSPPYRIAYFLRRALGRWPYPPEKALTDLNAEARASNSLEQVGTYYFDKETVFAILPKPQLTSLPFRLLDKLLNFQPYLKVFELIRRADDTP